MRLLPGLALLLASGGLAAADDKARDAELKAMVGRWKIEKAELGGKDVTEMV